jgi:hypothetical protein
MYEKVPLIKGKELELAEKNNNKEIIEFFLTSKQ